jgi:hypothetical protein
MRSLPYMQVLQRIAGSLGEADGLSVEDSVLMITKINLFVRLAWEYYWWPDFMNIEKRMFRPQWNADTEYNGPAINAPVEVFFPMVGQGDYSNNQGAYYQSLQPSAGEVPATYTNGTYVENGAFWALSCSSYAADLWQPDTQYGVNNDSSGQPYQVQNPGDGCFYQCINSHVSGDMFDPSQWGLLTPFVRSIAYDQVDGNGVSLTPLGEVRFIWDRDPTIYRAARPTKFVLRSEFVQVLGCQNVVWVEFRVRPNVYTNTPYESDVAYYESDVAYAAGIQIYDPQTGENWIANQAIEAGQSPSLAPAEWDLVPFPYYFVEYVAQSAYVSLTNREEMAASQGGQPESFTIQQTAGYPFLLIELDKIERQQGQVRQLNVVGGKESQGGWLYRK